MVAANIKSGWSSGSLVFERGPGFSDGKGIFFGIDGSGLDIKFFGDTAGAYMLWDQSADSLLLIGGAKLTVGVSGAGGDVTFYGDTAGADFVWDQDGATNGSLTLGASTKSVDFKVFGVTANNYLFYDGSEDKLAVVQTNAATTGVETCFSNAMTMTGIGASAEAAAFALTVNAAAGTYTNALAARVTYGASGKTTGLNGVICSELNLSAGCTDGTYTLFEGEMIMASGALTGTATSFFCLNVSGAAAATFDTNGYLFDIQGVTSNSGKFWYANKSVPFDAYLRIRVGNTAYYLGVLAQQAAAS